MKVGDKVVCIKDRFGLFTEFLKGKKYEISRILQLYQDQTMYYISCGEGDEEEDAFFKNPPAYRLFSEYFITEQEVRKRKLLKIDERTGDVFL